ncbi:MAG: sulfatase-like hydrolase/transferase, partial [Planctomycetaceae bacterium]|nr:sulfatase-like hydrolase/transferase [Planctomycetaceae bacterium]
MKCRWWCVLMLQCVTGAVHGAERPNILLAISDDQSWLHASAYGTAGISTPAFDRVAREGVLCRQAFGASPGCSPCRAALLTGRHCWQLEEAGTHGSSFQSKYQTFPERLATAGYFTGHTGKGWGPGNFQFDGRTENPAGPRYSKRSTTPPFKGMSRTDYAANFVDFLDARPKDTPFCFWYGGSEPHRAFEAGSGLKTGKKLEDAAVPPFLPDHPEIRSDILDYYVEIEWFDQHLGKMLAELEARGELDNTLVIVTSDNGMAFPRAKANCYEYGIHMPLAIRWGNRVPGGRSVDDLIGFVDLTATIFEAAGVAVDDSGDVTNPLAIAGRSLLSQLTQQDSGKLDPTRSAVFSSRERHSSSRYWNLAYPMRSMRTTDHLLIWNARPERWPAGPAQRRDGAKLSAPHSAYHDIDGCPSLSLLSRNSDDLTLTSFRDLAVQRRPEFELFDIRQDPGCLHNLAVDPKSAELLETLKEQLDNELRRTGDPRVVNPDGGEVFETYRRYAGIRAFPEPDWAKEDRETLEADGWIRLFDGETLDGWKVSGPEGSFTVVNGMIRAQAKADQAHLFYVGADGNADFTDFELRVDCLTTLESNGGIYFHTSWQEADFPNDGHEVQVNNSHKNKTRTGS